MSAVIQELLLDASMHRLHIDIHSDILVAVQEVLTSGVFTRDDAAILDLYLSGYSVEEIAFKRIAHVEFIEDILRRLFTAIETTSGYSDEDFLKKVQVKYRHRPIALTRLKEYLEQRSQVFSGAIC